jgi:hypothetical protein
MSTVDEWDEKVDNLIAALAHWKEYRNKMGGRPAKDNYNKAQKEFDEACARLGWHRP